MFLLDMYITMSGMNTGHGSSRWTGEAIQHSVPIPDDPNNSKLASTCYLKCTRTHCVVQIDDVIHVYRLQDFLLTHSFQLPQGHSVADFDLDNDLLAIVFFDGDLHIWDLLDYKCAVVNLKDATLDYDAEVLPSAISFLKAGPIELGSNGLTGTSIWPQEPTVVIQDRPFDRNGAFWIWRLHRSDKEYVSPRPSFLRRIHTGIGAGFFKASGKTVATGCDDCTVRLWNLMTGDCDWVLIGHSRPVRQLCLDQSNVYSGSEDGTIRIWDIHSGRCLSVLNPHLGRVATLTCSSTHIMSCHLNRHSRKKVHIILWDIRSGDLVHNVDDSRQLSWPESQMVIDDYKMVVGGVDLSADEARFTVLDIRSGDLIDYFGTNGTTRVKGFASTNQFCVALIQRRGVYSLDVWDLRNYVQHYSSDVQSQDIQLADARKNTNAQDRG
ncbi:hypothetical protein CVT26_013558 [Gymnopilus dilepis]|uniref:Uncharacterized protein n=1 Tax=Gymnopilus dilepis TaxID=231916 RepID=A0A409YWX9_9AGAR|nr:hypothetical protein CVT26_013558 [Gymnopilus dilepis]